MTLSEVVDEIQAIVSNPYLQGVEIAGLNALGLTVSGNPILVAVVNAAIAAIEHETPPTGSPKFAAHFRATAPAALVAAPTSLEDILSNADVYAVLAAYVATLGITDSTLLSQISSLQAAEYTAGLTLLSKYAAAQTPPMIDPTVEHGTSLYGLDTATGELVSITPIPASSVPVS